MPLFGDVPVDLLSSKDMFRSGAAEFEALSCEEREEVMVLVPTAEGDFEAEGQALASCIYYAILPFLLLLLLW